MITQDMKTANAISGKTARACESCLKSRARWFCPADDAFLCHTCDWVVHSANELASRHKRVRLQTASFKPIYHEYNTINTNLTLIDESKNSYTNHHMTSHEPTAQPSWLHGFTKKARTPRQSKCGKAAREKQAMMMMPVVPEMSSDEGSVEEESEEHMVFSVPIFDPFEVPCDEHHHDDHQFNISLIGFEGEGMNNDCWDNLPGFGLDQIPSESDLAEFAADVETLLEQGTDEEVHSAVPLITCRETDSKRSVSRERGHSKNEAMVKVEEVEEENEEEGIESCGQFDWAMDLEDEVLNFEEEEKKVMVKRTVMEGSKIEENMEREGNNKKRRKIFLRLNYEDVISTWVGSSPWTNGCRPELDLDRDGWPNCLGGVNPMNGHRHDGGMTGERKNVNGRDDGRQARVSRYREKKRTRLFSKKIRYEVRKLNAEKRPRLKGRFVKRTSLAPLVGVGPTFSYMNK